MKFIRSSDKAPLLMYAISFSNLSFSLLFILEKDKKPQLVTTHSIEQEALAINEEEIKKLRLKKQKIYFLVVIIR